MADQFERRPVELDSPAREWAVITPSNTVDIPVRPRAIFVGTAGDVSAVGSDGVAVVFSGLQAGWHPIGPKRINATGTTAANIIGIR